MPTSDRSDTDAAARWRLAGGLVAAAAALRFTGLCWGFPALLNGDEPHLVNVAVSFGRGTLNPGIFKYPTLWMYLLFAAYGAYFLAWSGLGLRRSVADFGALFVWHPDRFFLIGRVLSAACSLAVLERVHAAGRALGEARLGLWAAGLLAVSFKVVESAHAAKPDSLMLLLAACAWAAALAHLAAGGRGALLASAAFAGLACSAQYTAAPAALASLTAFLARRRGEPGGRPPWSWGLAAAALVPAAFLAGTPFSLLDASAFRRDLLDHAANEFARAASPAAVLVNVGSFAGPAWLCVPLLAVGAAALWARDRRAAAVLTLPVLVHLAVLMPAEKGGVFRYLFASLPALALVAAHGVEELCRLARVPLERSWARAAVLTALMLPGGVPTAVWAASLRLPDTRLAASAWFEANVPAGTRVLIGAETDNPPLRPSQAQAERLAEKTRAAGHPRERYWRLMAASHPGGGWEVVQMTRDAAEMDTGPWHRAWSDAGRETLDVSGGLAAVRAAGVRVVVLSSMGLGLGTPGVARFLRETEAQGRLLAEFRPEPGRSAGPSIRIFELPEKR